MKTTISSANKNTFRNIITGLTLSAALFFGQVASAQTVSVEENAPIQTQMTDGFKVAIHPVINSLFMKVHFVNPNKELVTVLIKNSKDEVVYRKNVGRNTVFHGKFDVSNIADGTYTMVVQSTKHSHSNAFAVETLQERIALAK